MSLNAELMCIKDRLPSVGDIIMASPKGKPEMLGMIISIDKKDISDDLVWVRIMWSDSQITWEDLIASNIDGDCDDSIFQNMSMRANKTTT